MNKSIVSIIMPAYNSEKYVAEAIESVLRLTYSNWELIIIDDGSTDRTSKIVDSYVSRNARIKVIHTENGGVSHARNFGLETASGEWISFLDSDDMLTVDALQNLLAHSQGRDLVIGNYRQFPDGIKNNKRLLNDIEDISRDELITSCMLIGTAWGMVFRRSKLKECFTEGLQLGEDTLFFYGQLRYCDSISTIHEVVYLYRRENEQSLSHQIQNYSFYFIEQYAQLLNELLGNDIELSYAHFVHYCVSYIRMVASMDEFSESQKLKRINEVLASKYLREIPFSQLSLASGSMRLFSLLKIGDVELIRKELNM